MMQYINIKGVAIPVVEDGEAINICYRVTKLVLKCYSVVSVRFVKLIAPGKCCSNNTFNTAPTKIRQYRTLGLGRFRLCQRLCRPSFSKQHLQIVRRDCEVQVLPILESGDGNTDDLAISIQYWPTTTPGRDRSSNLQKLVNSNLSDTAHDTPRECTFQPPWISNGINSFPNLNSITTPKSECRCASSRNFEDYKISSRVNSRDAFNVVLRFLTNNLCVASRGTFDDMKVTGNFVVTNEEPTTKRDGLPVSIFHDQEYSGFKGLFGNILSALCLHHVCANKH